MNEVACPGCGQERFSAVAGSECYCSCGTAFRIGEDGTPIPVPRGLPAERIATAGMVRRLLGAGPKRTRPA